MCPNPEYYDAPKAVENLAASVEDGTNGVGLTFNPVYETRGGEPLTQIDAIYIMRDGRVVDSLLDVSDSQVSYSEELEKNGTYYYTVYAVNEAGMSKVARDTVMVGSTCDLRFELADTGENGWDMSFIAVLDEEGKISQRVGLWDGGSASLTVPVPSDQKATFFWTYDNTCYSHGSLSEVSYEIYDWDDNLIVASNGYPVVGPITDYEINCDPNSVVEQEVMQTLYPNPASHSFTVEGKIKEIRVYNALGQLMHQGTMNVVEVNAWHNGLYFVRIVDENNAVSTVKFIKE